MEATARGTGAAGWAAAVWACAGAAGGGWAATAPWCRSGRRLARRPGLGPWRRRWLAGSGGSSGRGRRPAPPRSPGVGHVRRRHRDRGMSGGTAARPRAPRVHRLGHVRHGQLDQRHLDRNRCRHVGQRQVDRRGGGQVEQDRRRRCGGRRRLPTAQEERPRGRHGPRAPRPVRSPSAGRDPRRRRPGSWRCGGHGLEPDQGDLEVARLAQPVHHLDHLAVAHAAVGAQEHPSVPVAARQPRPGRRRGRRG